MQTTKSFPGEVLNWKNEAELADAVFERIQVFVSALFDDTITNMITDS